MTVWGAWSYAGGNGVRFGVDWAYTSGNVLTAYISTQTQYAFSGDAFNTAWSGGMGSGSASGAATLTCSAGQVVSNIWSITFGAQPYNSTATITISGSAFYNGSTPSVTFGAVLGPLPPAAPTSMSALWVSDTQANCTWVNNFTGTAPYDQVGVSRFDNLGGSSVVGIVSGSAGAFSDTGLVADRRYEFQAWAQNAAGYGYSAMSQSVYTTPASVSSLTATKVGSDIVLSWTNNSTYAASIPLEVWHGTITGGVTTWDGAVLHTTANGATTDTHVAPSSGSVHVYRVRPKAPATTGNAIRYGSYTVSNSVQLSARPLAPTGQTVTSTIQNGSTVDASVATTLGWTHNPQDSSGQTAYEVETQVSSDGGSTWAAAVSTGQVSSAVSSRVVAANTWAQNKVVRWRVRTWGAYAGTAPTYSDWSTYTSIYTSTRPVGAITTPVTCTTSVMTGTGGYTDAEGSVQASARWTLKDAAGNVLHTLTTSDSSKFLSYVFPLVVSDGLVYTIAYQVQDAAGLWSAEVTRAVTVTYAKPTTPTLVATWVEAEGYVSGTITNPAGGVAAIYNLVYRDGVLLTALASVDVNGSWIDYLPKLNAAPSYTVVAVSASPSTSLPSVAQVVNTTTTRVWFNSGPGMALHADVSRLPKLSASVGRKKTLIEYEDREDPVQYSSYLIKSFSGTLTGKVTDTELANLVTVVERPEVGCYRDSKGRKIFVSLLGVDYDDGAGSSVLKNVAVHMKRTSYAE